MRGQTESSTVARNAAARTVGEVVAKGASVVFFVVMARKLGERGFGDFMFALSFTTALVIAAGFGSEELIAREVSRDRRRIHDYLSNVVAVKVIGTVALLAVAIVVVNVAGYSADQRVAVYLVGTGVAVENLGRTWGSVFQAFERMELGSFVLILQRVVTAAAGTTALLLGAGLVTVSVLFLAGSLVGFAAGAWLLARHVVRPRIAVDRSRWVAIVRAGIPIGMVALLFTILLRVDQTMLSFLAEGGNREVGLYAAAFRLIEATMFIAWAFGGAIMPWLSRQDSPERVARGYALGTKVLTAVLLPIALAFVLLAEPLIDLLYGARYDEAVVPLRLLGATTLFVGLNQMASVVLIARDRPALFTRLLAATAVLNIALNVALIPAQGATGAATAAFISGALLLVGGMAIIAREVGSTGLVRPFASPALAGMAMTAAIFLTGLPLVPAALVGSVAYVLVLGLAERRLFPDDFAFIEAVARRALGRPAGAGV